MRASQLRPTELRKRLFLARLRRAGSSIESGVEIAPGSRITTEIRVGRGTRINGPCVIKGSQPVGIGRYCAVGDGVRMISSNHRYDLPNLQGDLQRRLGLGNLDVARGPIEVGHNVWIGDAAIILSGVAVGNGAVVGAGAVVTRDVPAYAIAVGSPARVIGARFEPEVIAELEALRWWEWSEERMREQPDWFLVAHPRSEDAQAPLATARS
jgi:virginiamycin A acetyltransferase